MDSLRRREWRLSRRQRGKEDIAAAKENATDGVVNKGASDGQKETRGLAFSNVW